MSFASIVANGGSQKMSTSPVTTTATTTTMDDISQISSSESVMPLLAELEVALKMELKYHSNAQPTRSDNGLITSGMRDGSAHVLRCLKVWYDLPSDVFFSALLSIDRFLQKMKAQPKHLSCIAVSSFHLSCTLHRDHIDGGVTVPDTADLVNISQSRCSPSDLLRMQAILASRVAMINPGAVHEPPVNVLTLLRLLYAISKAAAPDLLPAGAADMLPNHLVHQLEILACDSLSLGHRPAEVALALLTTEFQRLVSLKPENTDALMALVTELQKLCRIQPHAFASCLRIVVGQLDNYNGEGTVVHRQRLVWKLSNRTLRHLRPTDKLRATLPTIQEKTNIRRRSNSECSEESLESLHFSGDDSEREMECEEQGLY